jgi:hypothetical protein
MTACHVKHASEINTNEGPTGEWVEVLRGKVMDFGGNVLCKGDADKCVRFAEQWNGGATRLVPTQTRRVGEIAGSDVLWEGTSKEAVDA